MIYQDGVPVTEIVLHCSATRPQWMVNSSLHEQVAEITKWHVEERGFRTIGYHWIVGRNGTRLPGRPEDVKGAGVKGHNDGVIHICLIGAHGAAATDTFEEHFTPGQLNSVKTLIAEIMSRTKITKITGHNEYAAKGCPGFIVKMEDWAPQPKPKNVWLRILDLIFKLLGRRK